MVLTFMTTVTSVCCGLYNQGRSLGIVIRIKLPRRGDDDEISRAWGLFKVYGHILMTWTMVGLVSAAILHLLPPKPLLLQFLRMVSAVYWLFYAYLTYMLMSKVLVFFWLEENEEALLKDK